MLLAVVLLVWVPFRNSVIGRAAYAIGSSEAAAYMSGIPIGRVKIAAYALSGLLASIAGLLLTFVTYSGEASSSIGGTYTLNSIAAVVIGGTSLLRRHRQRGRLDLRRLRAALDRAICCSCSISTHSGSRCSRA